jgi:hypothetical protein
MADFDLAQLNTDWGAVCSVTYAGEAFLYAGGATTIYGVFTEQDADLTFELSGRDNDKRVGLHFNRGALTPAVDVTIYRFFDSTTYRIIKADPDLAGWICQLKMPY